MAKATILFADNDPDFLRSRTAFLEYQGYEVIPATNPAEARQILARGQVDIAILDIRMVSDDDDKDTSGLTLAKETVRSVPKIILTAYPTYEAVREALEPALEGMPPVVDFIAKQEGPETLIEAIRKILKFEVLEFQEIIDSVSEKLQRDYEDAQREARMNHRAGLGIAVVGILILLAGIGLAISGVLAIGLVSAIGGVVAEGLSILFLRSVAVVNKRMESLHGELLQFRRLEALLAGCGERSSQEERQECQSLIREIIRQTAEHRSLARSGPTDQPSL